MVTPNRLEVYQKRLTTAMNEVYFVSSELKRDESKEFDTVISQLDKVHNTLSEIEYDVIRLKEQRCVSD